MNAFPHDSSYCEFDYTQPAPQFPPSAAFIADPPTVLVVDDDPFYRELETRALSHQGYNVLQADGAAEALRLAGSTPSIALLLTDFVMPDVNGLELARRFRALHPKTPVLMVSGSLSLLNGEIDEMDCVSIVEKSSSFAELLGKVHSLLTVMSPLPLPAASQCLAPERPVQIIPL